MIHDFHDFHDLHLMKTQIFAKMAPLECPPPPPLRGASGPLSYDTVCVWYEYD